MVVAPAGIFAVAASADAFNAIAADHDELIPPRLIGLAVDEHSGANDGDGRSRLGKDTWGESKHKDQSE